MRAGGRGLRPGDHIIEPRARVRINLIALILWFINFKIRIESKR